ncbi:MAG: hypothetical protein H0T84_02705 [Tatlockia sp.]|nr:hypothetical protein [Tatlockia sp.]
MAKLEKEILRLKKIFKANEIYIPFLEALDNLNNLASQEDHSNPTFFPRSENNWAPTLIEKLTDLIKYIDSEKTLKEELPFIIILCQEYEKKPEVSSPWLKALTILLCAAVGALLGLPLGVIIGTILSVYYLAKYCYTTKNPLFMVFGISGIPPIALIFGCISGVLLGSYAGIEAGYLLTATDYKTISNTLLYQDEHKELSDKALALEKSALDILKADEDIESDKKEYDDLCSKWGPFKS